MTPQHSGKGAWGQAPCRSSTRNWNARYTPAQKRDDPRLLVRRVRGFTGYRVRCLLPPLPPYDHIIRLVKRVAHASSLRCIACTGRMPVPLPTNPTEFCGHGSRGPRGRREGGWATLCSRRTSLRWVEPTGGVSRLMCRNTAPKGRGRVATTGWASTPGICAARCERPHACPLLARSQP